MAGWEEIALMGKEKSERSWPSLTLQYYPLSAPGPPAMIDNRPPANIFSNREKLQQLNKNIINLVFSQ